MAALGGIEAMWLQVIRALAPQPRTVLDIGCRDLRSSKGIVALFGKGYHGVDVNPVAIRAAREMIMQVYHVGEEDFGKVIGKVFDLVYASCVVYHLRDSLAAEFFRTLKMTLAPEGVALFNVNTIQKETHWEGLPFVKRPLSFYQELAKVNGFAMRNLGSISLHGYQLETTTATNLLLELRRF